MAASTTLDEVQHSPTKRQRHLINNDNVFEEFPSVLIKGLADALNHWLLDKNSFSFKTLTPLKILNCNAADSRQGNSFAQVFCSVEPCRQLYPLGNIFTKGLLTLTDFMSGRKVPQNTREKHVLRKLLTFMMEEAEQASMKNLETYNETELAIVLANHLFGKLSTSETFVVDKHSKFKRNQRGEVKCPCEITTCNLTGFYGDTSMGNCHVWHGNLNMIINNDMILEPVVNDCQGYLDDTSSEDDEDDDNSLGERSRIEVKDCLSRNSKILAKTIVFSFLQKQRHPKNEHFLFPCIGVTGREMIVFFYDSQHDVLLESSSIPLFSENVTAFGKTSTLAVVIAWLVVNYKYLCNGLTEDMKSAKAMFFAQAESKLNIYENMLKLGDVGNSYRMEESFKDYLPPKPTLILEQLNETVLKLRHYTESSEGNV